MNQREDIADEIDGVELLQVTNHTYLGTIISEDGSRNMEINQRIIEAKSVSNESGPLPSAEPLYKELNILKFHDIFDLNVAKFIYSTLSGLSPEIFSNWFTYTNTVHSHATTSSVTINQTTYFDIGTTEPNKTLFTKNSNLVKYGARMISVYGPTLWNRIPKKIQESSSVATFKIQLKKHLINQYNSDNNNINNNNNNTDNNSNNNSSSRNNNNNNNNQNTNINNTRRGHRSRLANNPLLNQPFVSRWTNNQ